jgi:hypothetical protein
MFVQSFDINVEILFGNGLKLPIFPLDFDIAFKPCLETQNFFSFLLGLDVRLLLYSVEIFILHSFFEPKARCAPHRIRIS